MSVQPYLFLEGRCEEALAFWRDALGAEVEGVMRYRESPDPPPPGMLAPGSEDRIMHSSVRVAGATLMASDGMCSGTPRFEGFSIAVAWPDLETARRRFDALADGGEVRMPFGPTFWSAGFGMVADRFGVPWMVMVADAGACA